MKWLAEYIELPNDPKEVAECLTLAGLEVEGIERLGELPETIVVGEILERNPHPNADKLSVCKVNSGEETLQIVCGAPNCDTGKKVPLAKVGTVFEGGFKIKKSKLRGKASHGMMCSSRELGLGDSHEGLLELPQNAQIGAPISSVIEGDTVIDWEVTPNRPDWLSHIGIAREAAAVFNCRDSFKKPSVDLPQASATPVAELVSVEINDEDLCPRYTARVIKNVKVGPSPEWMQDYLTSIGLRPINNIVDITNFVLHECGQPLHAFDCEKLAGGKIIVRRAAEGETITTLDDVERKLTTDHLLIADAKKGVALAGVMGAANSEISEETTTILLESAAFHPSNIRASSRGLGLISDSSYRFERGVSHEGVEFASKRAAALICELAGGELADGVIDLWPGKKELNKVSARFAKINSLIGVDIAPEQVKSYLELLEFRTVEITEESITLEIPDFRQDIEREADIIEEVARIHGLDNIPAAVPAAVCGGCIEDDAFFKVETVRNQLLALGLTEAMSYTLQSAAVATKCTGIEENELVQLSNPISAESGCFRGSLIPDMIQIIARNVAHDSPNMAMFETGRVTSTKPGLPEERMQAGIILTGCRHPELYGTCRTVEVDFFDLKGILESWMEERGIESYEVKATEHPSFKPSCCAELRVNDKHIACFGEITSELTSDIRLKHPVFIALIELDTLLNLDVQAKTFTPLPQFPATERDVSVVVAESMQNQKILTVITSVKNKLLQKAELIDIYQDDELKDQGKHSMTYAVTYRSEDKTLTDKQVNKVHEQVRKTLEKELGADFR